MTQFSEFKDGEQTAFNRSIETRFKEGNQAARTTGLRAGSRKELRRRDARTSRLFGKYLRLRADEGRPISGTALPLARRYCETEILCRDTYAALVQHPNNAKLHAMYISSARLQALLAAQLGESLATLARIKVSEAIAGNSNGLAAQLARYRLTAPSDEDA